MQNGKTDEPALALTATDESANGAIGTRCPTRRSKGACLERLRVLAEDWEIAHWAARYLRERVLGTSPLTLLAKARDLEVFIEAFTSAYGHGELRAWGPQETRHFLELMEASGRAPATRNRLLATMRHFARWLQTHPDSPVFSHPLPTLGVPGIRLQEPGCKKLSAEEVDAMAQAADQAVLKASPSRRHRALRDRAIFLVLLHSGLRISEVLALNIDQYVRHTLEAVQRKGGGRTTSVYLTSPCRAALDEYLGERGQLVRQGDQQTAPPLFATRQGNRLTRGWIRTVLRRWASVVFEQMGQVITIHPHMLRHTFGAAYRQSCGSDAETAAALGHTGLGYVGRYVRQTEEERGAIKESLFDFS